jgi:ABC-type nitrate/sulfonate/bicarbonate transport system permease component
MSRSMQRGADALVSVLVVLVLLGLWWGAVHWAWVSPVFLPGPVATWAALVDGWSGGDLGRLSLATTERMFYGWALASVVGMLLGALIGISPTLRVWLMPTLELVRPLPASAIVPIVIAFLGLSPAMVLVVVVFGSVWPVLLATIHGFASVEPRLHEVARVLRLSPMGFIWKIGLPHALPDALAGMRVALTVSLILAIVGEMLASQDGLGLAILQAARSFHAADLFASVALLGVLGLASNTVLHALEHRLLAWKRP